MKNPINYIRYPIYLREFTFLEKVAKTAKVFPIKCNICDSFSLIEVDHDNFRETCICKKCRSFNRQRQIAFVLCNSMSDKHFKNFREFLRKKISVYNTEAGGALHNYLSKMESYQCSEYFGDQYSSGEMVNNIMNQDLMALSFKNDQFDLIISTDVFEHVPDPIVAHKEVYRILKTGGRHVFTVPFYQTLILDEVRATMNENHEIVHNKEPWYHIDPLRKEGILAYNIFSIEMLVKLARIGFRTNMYLLYSPANGIFGFNGLVFEAIKE